jgi:hypothetical protein
MPESKPILPPPDELIDSNLSCIGCNNEAHFQSFINPVVVTKVRCRRGLQDFTVRLLYAVDFKAKTYGCVGCSKHLPLIDYVDDLCGKTRPFEFYVDGGSVF